MFRAGVEVVSLNVTVTDSAGPLHHRSRAERFLGVRGRRQAGAHLLHTHQPADRAVAADRLQRQHGRTAHGERAGRRRSASRSASARRIWRRSSTSTAASRSRRGSPHKAAPRKSDSRHLGRRLDGAAQRGLHLAEGTRQDQGEESADEVRRQAIVVLSDGEDTPSLVSFEEVLELAKRSETGDLHDRPAAARAERAQGIPRSRVRAAPAGAGNRRPRVLRPEDRGAEGRLRPDRRRAVQPVLDGLRARRTPSATARSGGWSCRWTAATPPRAPNADTTGRRVRIAPCDPPST